MTTFPRFRAARPRTFLRAALAAAAAAWLLAAAPAAAGESAVCPVCRVKEGSAHQEPVVAWRTHEGVRYGFCAEDCAREFDADPAAYVLVLPRPAPELRLTALDGSPVTWEALAGRLVLVDFWATWCAPCRRSMPELQALHDRYRDRGFTVVGVSIDEPRDRKKVRKFVDQRRIRYPVAIDTGKDPAWERYRVKAIPAAFLVRDGQIVAQWTGAVDARDLERRLGELLARAE